MRRWGVWVAAVAVAMSTSGCWFQLGGTATRLGANNDETGLSTANVGQLHQRWSATVPCCASAPVIYGGKVYVAGGITLTALNGNNGATVWTRQLPLSGSHFDPPSFGEPVIDGANVEVPVSYTVYGSVDRYDLATGASQPALLNGPGYYFAPAAHGGVVAVTGAVIPSGSGIEEFVAYNGHIGELGVSSLSQPAVPSSPMILGDHVYASTGTQVMSFPVNSCTPSPVNPSACAPDWSVDLGSNASMPVGASADTIAVALANGNVAVLDTAGNVQWQAATGSTDATVPAVANGTLYVGAHDGKVHEFALAGCGSATCTETGAVAGSDPIGAQPLVANGVVYAGTTTGKFAAYSANPSCTAATCPALYSATVGNPADSVRIVVDNATVWISAGAKVLSYAVN